MTSIALFEDKSQAHDAPVLLKKVRDRQKMSYYALKLYPFVTSLIRDNRARNGSYFIKVDNLSYCDRWEFAAHILEYHDRDIFSIYENKNINEIVSSLLKMLNSNTQDNKINFADKVCTEITKYYEPEMQKLLDEISGWVEREDSELNPDYFEEAV